MNEIKNEQLKKELSALRAEITAASIVWKSEVARIWNLIDQKEEEPAEKLSGLDFWDALRIVEGTERRVKYGERGAWFTCEYGKALYIKGESGDFYPDIEQQKEKNWFVEPEKSKEIFVWGVCWADGESLIFPEEPEHDVDCDWVHKVYSGFPLARKNLFPKDKPQKFRLVPVEENV